MRNHWMSTRRINHATAGIVAMGVVALACSNGRSLRTTQAVRHMQQAPVRGLESIRSQLECCLRNERAAARVPRFNPRVRLAAARHDARQHGRGDFGCAPWQSRERHLWRTVALTP